MSRWLMGCLWLSMLLLGCGKATDKKYQGDPLATVHGRIELGGNFQPTGPVQLALIWYPAGGISFNSPPASVITRDVTYTGQFPQSFALDLFQPPPDAALLTGDTGSHAAFGVVLAFIDGNGNGTLDSTDNGPLVDKVVGTSLGPQAPFDPLPAHAYELVWLDKATGELPAGYSLVDFTPTGPQLASLDAGTLELSLVDEPRLGLWICNESYDNRPGQSPEACGLQRSLIFSISLQGDLQIINGQSLARFNGEMDNGTIAVGSAGTLNGHPFDANDGTHLSLSGNEADLLVAGTQHVTLTRPGGVTLEADFVVPGVFTIDPFDVTTPSGPLTISWSASANAQQYLVFVTRFDGAMFTSLPPVQLADGGTSITFPDVPGGQGNLSVLVTAATQPPTANFAAGAPIIDVGRSATWPLQ